MFDNISLNYYNFGFQLQRSQFLVDTLYPNVTFHLDCNDHFHIYRHNEYIANDELIFYIHYIVSGFMFMSIQNTTNFSMLHIYHQFIDMFGDVDDLMKSIDKIYILLKYRYTRNKCEINPEYEKHKIPTVGIYDKYLPTIKTTAYTSVMMKPKI